MATTSVACQAIWIRRILENMQQKKEEDKIIFCDNLSTITMTKNSIHHKSTRQIDIRHHLIREHVTRGDIKMGHCSIEEQVVDLFTKSLPLEKFVYLTGKLGVADFCIKGEHVMGNA